MSTSAKRHPGVPSPIGSSSSNCMQP
jgi:hypothetical protein